MAKSLDTISPEDLRRGIAFRVWTKDGIENLTIAEWGFFNRKRAHRLDGPAIIKSGSRHWYVDGKRHRLDGPAVERTDGMKVWWLDGVRIPSKEVKLWLEENNLVEKDLKKEEIQIAFKLRWS